MNGQSGIRKIPLEDFFKNPKIAAYQISPDGKTIASLQPFENRMNIFIEDRKGGLATRLTSEKDRDIAGFFWKGNHTLLYMKDFGGDENFHVFAIDTKGGKVRDLTPFAGVKAEIADDLQYVDDHAILVALNKRNREIFDVYHLTLETGKLKLVAQNPGKVTNWVTDHKGKVRVAIESDGVNQVYYSREKENEKFRRVFSTDFKTQLSPQFFTFDNKNLYALSNIGRDKTAIVEFDISNGAEIKTLYEHPENDMTGLGYSHKRKILTRAQFTTWKRMFHFFDPEQERIYNQISSQLPGVEVMLSDWDLEEKYYIVRTYTDRSLGAYYLYDVKENGLKKIGDLSPWLKDSELSEMKPITYKSRDGLEIQGYLTLPKGRDAQNLPVVINPHGGPWHRDTWGFNPQVQFLANRGYAVLQMNFRGSTGYGRKFWEASFKQWGKKMQDDVSDGVKWLINQGIADSKRVCIYGGSYGGYATLAGLAFSPELYACGVDYVGVSNLLTFMKTIPPYWKPMLDQFYEMVGNPETEKDLLRAASPVFHADRIRAPLLVAQGAKDPRVNINESNQIVESLKKRGIDVPYLVKENEGHGFHNEENRMEFYRAMEMFLEKHLQTSQAAL